MFSASRSTDSLMTGTGRDGCLARFASAQCLAARLRWVLLSASSRFWVSICLWLGGWRRRRRQRQRQPSLSIIILIDNRPNLSFIWDNYVSDISLKRFKSIRHWLMCIEYDGDGFVERLGGKTSSLYIAMTPLKLSNHWMMSRMNDCLSHSQQAMAWRQTNATHTFTHSHIVYIPKADY